MVNSLPWILCVLNIIFAKNISVLDEDFQRAPTWIYIHTSTFWNLGDLANNEDSKSLVEDLENAFSDLQNIQENVTNVSNENIH